MDQLIKDKLLKDWSKAKENSYRQLMDLNTMANGKMGKNMVKESLSIKIKLVMKENSKMEQNMAKDA